MPVNIAEHRSQSPLSAPAAFGQQRFTRRAPFPCTGCVQAQLRLNSGAKSPPRTAHRSCRRPASTAKPFHNPPRSRGAARAGSAVPAPHTATATDGSRGPAVTPTRSSSRPSGNEDKRGRITATPAAPRARRTAAVLPGASRIARTSPRTAPLQLSLPRPRVAVPTRTFPARPAAPRGSAAPRNRCGRDAHRPPARRTRVSWRRRRSLPSSSSTCPNGTSGRADGMPRAPLPAERRLPRAGTNGPEPRSAAPRAAADRPHGSPAPPARGGCRSAGRRGRRARPGGAGRRRAGSGGTQRPRRRREDSGAPGAVGGAGLPLC